jgi:hypothetical protein
MLSWRCFSRAISVLYLFYLVWSESALVSGFIQSNSLQDFLSPALLCVSQTHLGSLYTFFELSCISLCDEPACVATTKLAPHCSARATAAFKSVSYKPLCFCTHSRFFPFYWTCAVQLWVQSSFHTRQRTSSIESRHNALGADLYMFTRWCAEQFASAICAISRCTSVSHFWTEMLRFVLWRKCFEVNDEAPTMHRRQTPLSTLAFTKNLAACTSLFND